MKNFKREVLLPAGCCFQFQGKGGIIILEDIMFEQENRFYEENKDNLRNKYLGKEVVIVGDKVIAAYDDVGTAIRETVKTRPLGSFCVKNIPESPEEKIIRIPTFLVSR